jgi:hypothetical protein
MALTVVELAQGLEVAGLIAPAQAALEHVVGDLGRPVAPAGLAPAARRVHGRLALTPKGPGVRPPARQGVELAPPARTAGR